MKSSSEIVEYMEREVALRSEMLDSYQLKDENEMALITRAKITVLKRTIAYAKGEE